MKKIFQMIGLVVLTCFSFFITEKTTNVVNNMDSIMIEIKSNKDKYKIEYVDASISNNKIIPGIMGREVNINKSYKNMKQNGYYSDKLYVYNYTKPKISLDSNKDKYIIKGNPKKRMVSLIFKVDSNTFIDDIISILDNYNIKATFFISYDYLINNDDRVINIIKDGHNVSPLLDDYSISNYEWMNMVIKKINKEKHGFCYNVNYNDSNLNECVLKNNYTIVPVEISEKNPFSDVKDKIEPGSLLSFNINSSIKKELSTIIIYIRSKGYNIANLEENVIE